MTSKLRWILLAILAAVHLCGVLIVSMLSYFALLHYQIIFLVSLGLLGGQICLLALWGSLGPGRVTTRLPTTLMFLILLYYSFAGAVRLLDDRFSRDAALTSLACLAAIYFAVQTPLWLGKEVFNWRIVEIDLSSSLGEKRLSQFSLRTLMLWTAEISTVLAMGRFLIRWNDESLRISAGGITEMSKVIAFMAPMACLVGLPSLTMLFITKKKRFGAFVIVIYYLLFFTLGPAILMMIISKMSGGPGYTMLDEISWWAFIYVNYWSQSYKVSLENYAYLNAAVLIMIWSNLGILYGLGFRFKSGQEPIAEYTKPAVQP